MDGLSLRVPAAGAADIRRVLEALDGVAIDRLELRKPTLDDVFLTLTMTDSLTFIGRSLRHSVRSIDALLTAILLPVAIMLMFVYVFGGAIETDGRYVDYVVPGIIVLCAGFGSAGTAVAVALDMTTGVIDRFRTLPISSAAVLTGHVAASVARNVVSTLLVIGVALLAGFRPVGGPARLAGRGRAAARADDRDLAGWPPASACSPRASRRPTRSRSSPRSRRTFSSAFVPPDTMPAGLRGSPSTSRSRRSPTRCASCCSGCPSAMRRSSPSPGASRGS